MEPVIVVIPIIVAALLVVGMIEASSRIAAEDKASKRFKKQREDQQFREDIAEMLFESTMRYIGKEYPDRIVGRTAGETRHTRVEVANNADGMALYRYWLANPNDLGGKAALADWLREQGFDGAADNLWEGK